MTKTLRDLLDRQYEVKATGRVSTVSVGDSRPATLIIGNNPNRTGLAIINASTASLYLSFNKDMGLTEGFYIVPSGGMLILNWRDDFDIVGWSWYGIASAAASAVNVVEEILD